MKILFKTVTSEHASMQYKHITLLTILANYCTCNQYFIIILTLFQSTHSLNSIYTLKTQKMNIPHSFPELQYQSTLIINN